MNRHVLKALLVVGLMAGSLVAIGTEQASAAVSCGGQTATKIGTAGSNFIIGTNTRDVINAKGGHDTILGLGGNDLICGGGGNDVIDGMAGSDPVWGGNGRDVCSAETATEHQSHRSCEVHEQPPTPTGGGTPSEPTTEAALLAPNSRLSPISTKVTTSAAPAAAYPEGAIFIGYPPECVPGRIDMQITAASPYASGQTGYLAIRTWWYQATGGAWDWYGFDPWQVYEVPHPSVGTGTIPLPSVGLPRGTTWFMGYETQWWNGSQWVDQTFDDVTSYNTSFGAIEKLETAWCISA
jgi:hypothetical protein